MITTVTLNPAIDKTINIKSINSSDVTMIQSSHLDAAGKGINVSKNLDALRKRSKATGFLAGSSGNFIKEQLSLLNIDSKFITIDGDTRTNLKIIIESPSEIIELNESGPFVSQSNLKQLITQLDNLLIKNDWLVLSGSLPKGLDNNTYKILCQRYKNKEINVIVDASKEPLTYAIDALPNIIKPNLYELQIYANKRLETRQDIIEAAKSICQKGVETVVCTLGNKGAIAVTKYHVYTVDALAINAHSTVGAGDAFVAGLVYGLDEQKELKTALKWATATAAAAAETTSTNPGSYLRIQDLYNQVNIKEEGN
ncbi:MAG: 1-phosphofructokinase [Candidatus Izemoplasmataceae bacterium]